MMIILQIKLFGPFFILIGLTITNAEVDCDEEPPSVTFKSCCDMPDFVKNDIKFKCFKEGVVPNGPHPCLSSCVFNESGILVDNELMENNLATYLNDIYNDSEKVEFLIKKFQYCNELSKKSTPKETVNSDGLPRCGSTQSGILIHCVELETFKDCPDFNWSNTDDCNTVREHFTKCYKY
ncbi:uncharacterized protein ACRADG_010101 [Cochliomyia hominivorax]